MEFYIILLALLLSRVLLVTIGVVSKISHYLMDWFLKR